MRTLENVTAFRNLVGKNLKTTPKRWKCRLKLPTGAQFQFRTGKVFLGKIGMERVAGCWYLLLEFRHQYVRFIKFGSTEVQYDARF